MTLFEYIAGFYKEGFSDTRSIEGVDGSVTLIANYFPLPPLTVQ